MQKFVNRPEAAVPQMLEGIAAAHSDLVRVIPGTGCVVRVGAPVKGKVGLVTAGGSGHEPAHGGYVGQGMLDAAVAGAVFSSPPADQMYQAIKAVDGGAGVLCIIKNYTGDVLNFGVARELAELDDIVTDQVIVNDDVAVKDSLYTTGRRGVAGTVFVHKIAGAMAASGASLPEVKAVAEMVIANTRSMGAALTPCIIPAVGKPNFILAEGEMEIGIGIHGEPGVEKRRVATADETAALLLERILEDLPYKAGDDVAVMVNGMGATPSMELYIVYRKVHALLAEHGITEHRVLVGEYMTSIEMAGLSITLLKLNDTLRELLDAPAQTIAWKSA
jgi:phosphoenolpyruvate---glycerone phosphotransferase subunit DhaK